MRCAKHCVRSCRSRTYRSMPMSEMRSMSLPTSFRPTVSNESTDDTRSGGFEVPGRFRMPESVLQSLTVEAFRGFNQRATIDLSGSAVLLRGPNGSGKTSLFDAFQWLLLGDVDRLRDLREQQRDEYLVNSYRLPGPAVVEAK